MQRKMTGLAILLALALPTVAMAGDPPRPVNTRLPRPEPIDADSGRLKWTDRPNLLVLFRLADDHAVDSGGDGEINCVLGKNRRPTNCVVVRETPEGRYGGFLIAMAKHYQAASVDSKGQSPVGRKVRFAFRMASLKQGMELKYGKD
ncbi:MAG: hypothetical protein JWR84_836 [Caulobacter sp.]|nr:hypothetical protein [Caulobacter sp.]